MPHSKRQLYTIKTFARKSEGQFVLHSGCFGCGKTYSLTEAFGLYCLKMRDLGITGLNFVLLGKTQQSVKKNMCNVLSKLFGDDFRYDGSKRDGKVKDAVLFDQDLHIIGLNDSGAESKFRGISDIMGVLHDEAVLCTQEQFNFIASRLRGDEDPRIPPEYVQHWYIGSTNPDAPTHFLLELVKDGTMKMVRWFMRDACWKGAKEYYEKLKQLYKGNPSFFARYLKGEWVSADRMVYPMFNPKVHILDDVDISYDQMLENFIAVDYGSDHPTGILIISRNHQGIYIVSKERKLRNTAPSDIVQAIAEFIDLLVDSNSYCSTVYVDPSAKGLKDELTKRKIEYTNALNSHEDGIGCIRTMLSTSRLYILSVCTGLISEIYTYRYKDTTNGKDEVVKIGDDLVDTMRYGVYTNSTKYMR